MMTQRRSWCAIFFLTFSVAAIAWAEIPDPPDPVESEIARAQMQSQWVQRVQEAFSLDGQGKTADALAALQSIQLDLPELDTDGLVAVAIGDCQFHLKQYDQALASYLRAAELHPALNDTIWVRLVETDLAQGKIDEASERLQEVLASGATPEQKAWACLRLGNLHETQAIRMLTEAEQAYRQGAGFDDLDGRHGCKDDWMPTHADDLHDATAQLQLAQRQITQIGEMMPVFWSDSTSPVSLPSAEISKARISGQITRTNGQKDAGPRQAKESGAAQTVELAVDKDGKVEVTLAGRKVELGPAAQRQILKHLEHTLRVAGQELKDPREGRQSGRSVD
jgi:tetratricopeptide (TPR) repeat protein